MKKNSGLLVLFSLCVAIVMIIHGASHKQPYEFGIGVLVVILIKLDELKS